MPLSEPASNYIRHMRQPGGAGPATACEIPGEASSTQSTAAGDRLLPLAELQPARPISLPLRGTRCPSPAVWAAGSGTMCRPDRGPSSGTGSKRATDGPTRDRAAAHDCRRGAVPGHERPLPRRRRGAHPARASPAGRTRTSLCRRSMRHRSSQRLHHDEAGHDRSRPDA